MSRWSLRPEQAEFSRLAWAFALSLAFHVLVYGGYQVGQKYHLWQNLHWPSWFQPPKFLTDLIKKKELPPPPRPQDLPLIFVTVNPAQASAEAPKDAKFYSDKNSVAANPKPDTITEAPKIEGKQTEVVRTEDVPRPPKFTPLQPAAAPPAPKPQEAEPEVKPKPASTPGDLTMAKPAPTPNKDNGETKEAKPPRPRTIKEALAQLQNNQLPSERIKQEGGVKRRNEMASLDTKATPFGAYDAALVEAISQRWFSLLDERDYASDSRGKVVLQFNLHHDGRVTEMNVAENTAGAVLGLICQKAVLDPAPFAAWPSDMRRTLGDVRHIQFTFYYN
jgi:hypothetical protein